MADEAAKPFSEEIILLAEKLGEVTDRLARIEAEHNAQTAPLDAAAGAQGSALKALEAALAGIKALNFHVLDNNLGAVSSRLSEVEKQADVSIKDLAAQIGEANRAIQTLGADVVRHLDIENSQRQELSAKRDADAVEFSQRVEVVRGEIATLQKTLAERIDAARKEFAEPKGFTPKGKYLPNSVYAKLDVVEFNGSSFLSSEDNNDEQPRKGSKKWQLLARRGGVPGGVGNFEALAGYAAVTQGGTGTTSFTKGDVLAASSATTLAKVPIGVDGQSLVADSASTGGVKWTTPSGTGDVVGPASAVDNAIARFNGITGKAIQEGVLVIADTTGTISGFGTGGGITLHGSGTITGADGAITLAASGTNQNITLKPSGTGAGILEGIIGNRAKWQIKAPSGGNSQASLELIPGSGGAGTSRSWGLASGISIAGDFAVIYSSTEAGAISNIHSTFAPTGNLLIGGTTDITGSGGLKVFGTTASTSTTTGSLINAGGFGNAGAGYFGSSVAATQSPASSLAIRGTQYSILATGADAVTAANLVFNSSNSNPIGRFSFAPNTGLLSWAAQSGAGDLDNTVKWSVAVSGNTTQEGTLTASGTGTHTFGTTNTVTLTAGVIAATGAGATIANGTAIPAGGTAGTGYKFSSTSNFGVFFGSGAPSLAAAKGSLYLRSDGTTTNDRAYINTDGSTTWTALTTAA